MARTGDWLTPRVNGLPRFDKPPLVYWVMGLGYALPGQAQDPLGTWAGRLPSALGTLITLLMLGDTLLRFPQPGMAIPDARPWPQLWRLCSRLGAALESHSSQ